MGPNILCDKSTIHALSGPLLDLLHNYLTLIIPPVLVLEILGDLAKEQNRGGAGPEFVRSMARKAAHHGAIPCIDFRMLILNELEGGNVSMDGRPVLSSENTIRSEAGEIGILVAEDPNEKALNRWRLGDFSDTEHLISACWRQRKHKINWRTSFRRLETLYSNKMRPKKNFEDVLILVEEILLGSDPSVLTKWLFEDLCLHEPPRISFTGMPDLSGFPYTRFCIKIALFAHFSMKFNLVSQKDDNLIDLEYLFYLPFCDTFSADDRFPTRIAKAFLSEKQMFVESDVLKCDLADIQTYLKGLSEEDRTKELQRIGPPESESSLLFQIWKRYMKPGYRQRPRLQLSKEQEIDLVARIKKHTEGEPISGRVTDISSDGADFVVRKRTLLRTDPCPCRSGKSYNECHGLSG